MNILVHLKKGSFITASHKWSSDENRNRCQNKQDLLEILNAKKKQDFLFSI